MRLLLPRLQLLDGEPLFDGLPLQEGAIPQLPPLDHFMPSPEGDAPLSAADVQLSAAYVPLPTDSAATQMPPGLAGSKRSIWNEHEAVPLASSPSSSGFAGAKHSIWSENEAVPSSASSPSKLLPLPASQERRQYTVPAPWEESHSSRRQGECDVAVLSSPAAQVVEEADTSRVSEHNFRALGGAATGSDRTADEEAARNLQQQHAAERDELRADVAHMQEAFGQVQTMVQVWGGEGARG